MDANPAILQRRQKNRIKARVRRLLLTYEALRDAIEKLIKPNTLENDNSNPTLLYVTPQRDWVILSLFIDNRANQNFQLTHLADKAQNYTHQQKVKCGRLVSNDTIV